MLNRAACSQPYSVRRSIVFQQLLRDAQCAPEERLPFLHPKTLHERYRQPRPKRHYHASSAKCHTDGQSSKSSEEQDKLKPEEDASARIASRLRPRVMRMVLSKDGWQGPLHDDSVDRDQTNLESTNKGISHWKPTSQEGQRDLQSLVQSLKAMSAQLKEAVQEDASKDEGSTALQWQPNDAAQIPISPLEKHAGRRRWKPKRLPTTEEKERLARNPWAAMLAGPMRLDAASKARFPVALLMDVGHVANPEDNEVYMMPDGLADLEAFDQRLKHGQRKAAVKRLSPDDAGEKLRILPYRLLLEELTDTFMVWNATSSAWRTKKGTIAKRILSRRWQEKAQKIAAYQNASEEYWNLREKQGETDDDSFKRPEKSFDWTKLQWQPEIAERTPNIMRQRVLLAFNHIAQKQNQPKDKFRKLFYVFEWPKAGSLPVINAMFSDRPVVTEYWNDMGDIESPQAITAAGERQGNKRDSRPPIAVQPSEIKREPAAAPHGQSGTQHEPSGKERSRTEEELPKLDKDDPRVWLPGSFVLHIGKAQTALAALPYLESSLKSTTVAFEATDPAFEHSKYIPPMITVGDTYRLPMFNLPAMLGPKFDTILSRILERHKQYMQIPASPDAWNHLIIIKSVAPGSHFLAQELWQLWRYLGGRDCLFLAAEQAKDGVRYIRDFTKDDPMVPGGPSGIDERTGNSKVKYRGLSDKAWAHLHELLGMKTEKK